MNRQLLRDIDRGDYPRRVYRASTLQRIIALLVILGACVASLLLQHAYAEAKLGDWQDQSWECKRSNSKILTRPSQRECMEACEQQAFTDGATKTTGYAWYTCGIAVKATFVKPVVVPTCTAPKPADETQTAACPAGTTGTFGQTRSYVAAPYPVCWARGDVWTPVLPPEGTCPTAPSEWTKCADENGSCVLTTRAAVRYGANTTWSTPRNFNAGSLACNNFTFGDPLPGIVKRCEYGAPIAEPEPPTPEPQTNGIRWEAVTKSVAGGDVTIREYRVYIGRDPASLGAETARVVTGTQFDPGQLAAGVWYFGVVAVSNDGGVSAMSNLATKTIP